MGEAHMKLVIAIIQDEDRRKLSSLLMEKGFRITQVNSSGGFLRAGNTTMMIGVEEQKLNELLDAIREVCMPRKQMISAPVHSFDMAGAAAAVPIEITIGGATVFVLDVDQFVRI